ncbi:MAG: alpha/beta fold hydrolase [Nostocoides sp.]
MTSRDRTVKRRARTPRRRIGLLAAAMMLPWAFMATAAMAATGPPTPTVSAPVTTGGITTSDLTVPVGPEPDGTVVTLDATVYSPTGSGAHPAVLIAHGFGGSKEDVADQARRLAGQGFVVLTYTARGFGASGGRIHLDDPDFEVADARALVSLLASRPDVVLDRPGDPRVGVVGGSYGGALALMLAATDPRVDTDVALITWNDLSDAFFPQQAVTKATVGTPAGVEAIDSPGPFKRLWANRFLGSAAATRPAEDGSTPGNPLCGRFDPAVCGPLLAAAQSGRAGPDLLDTLATHSPAPFLDKVSVPTYLIQGMTDTLFGLDQADATARALAANGTPVAVRWMDGGHDAVSTSADADEDSIATWLRHYLTDSPSGTQNGTNALPVPAFTYPGPLPRRADQAPLFTSDAYPGLTGSSQPLTWVDLPVGAAGSGGTLLTPPGGQPASMTSIPGLSALIGSATPATGANSSVATYPLAALPGQSVAADIAEIAETTTVVGGPKLRLRITSTGDFVTLFTSLWQVSGTGSSATASLPRSLVAPMTVPVTPGKATEVTLTLPAATWTMTPGSTWRVLLTSTDSAYANPTAARVDKIAVLGLTVPTVTGTAVPTAGNATDTETSGLLLALAAVIVGLGVIALIASRRRTATHPRPDLAGLPLVVDGLVKSYADGHRAVDDVSWRAEKGQVVGLLGPNGAGKTTTIRMILGLIAPDAGTTYVLGEPIRASAPVLRDVGALVEGPGFLPHLTGRANLLAYWRATGRPLEHAHLDEALSVAALGGAVDRPVRTYSHGMKQRLGIAQAMLGLPDLLILDEPTNGLDPPQIAAMRPILHAYAAAGRTVVISSHLLAEVEQTCSHVVVMHAGRVITTGAVSDLVASADTTVLELGPQGRAAAAVAASLRATTGIRSVDVEDGGAHGKVTVVADQPRGQVVRAALDAGGDVVGVGSRRHLEEVFLGVISAAAGGDDAPVDAPGSSLVERLRQVRAR